MINLEFLNSIRKEVGDFYEELYSVNNPTDENERYYKCMLVHTYTYKMSIVENNFSKGNWYLHCLFDKDTDNIVIDFDLKKLDLYVIAFIKLDKGLEIYKQFKKYLLDYQDLKKYLIDLDVYDEKSLSEEICNTHGLSFRFKLLLFINYVRYMIDKKCSMVFIIKNFQEPIDIH